jgi:type I restriction enzyme, S subunit
VTHIVRLGALACLVTKGTTPNTVGRSYVESGVPFVRSEDVNGQAVNWTEVSHHIDNETHVMFGRSQLRPGDLLVTIAGTIGRVGYVAEGAPPMNCNQAVALVRIERKDVAIPFLCYALQSRNTIDQFTRQKTTATVTNVSLQQLRDIELRLPPLEEQRRIVDILDRAAGIRRLRRQAQDTARQIVPALFNKMFGDPGTNPMGWAARPLGEVIAGFEGGRNLQADAESGAEGVLKILKVSAVTPGYVPPAHHFVRDRDLLISRANTAELVGATALVRNPPPTLLLPDKIWRILWRDPSPVTPDFLLAWFKQPAIRAAMSRLASGTSASMRNISQGRLSTVSVILPPLGAQHRFAEQSASLERLTADQATGQGVEHMLTASLQAHLLR